MDNDSDSDYTPSEGEEENSFDSSDDEDLKTDGGQTNQIDFNSDYILEDETGQHPHLETSTSQKLPDVEIVSELDSEGNFIPVNNLVEHNIDGHTQGHPSLKPSELNQKPIRKGETVYVYQCSFCYYQTTHRNHLKMHIQSCNTSSLRKHWQCPKCHIEYSYDDLTNEHCIPLEGDDRGRNIFHCPACSFENEDNVQVPLLKKIHPSSRSPFVCPRCKARIFGISILKTHLAAVHKIQIIYKCECCEQSFLRDQELEDHKKIHPIQQVSRAVKCSHCNQDFSSVDEMKQHMQRVEWAEQVKKNKELRIARERLVGRRKQFRKYKVISDKEEDIAVTELVKEYKEMSKNEEEIGQTELVKEYKDMSQKEEEIGQTELVEEYIEMSEKEEEIAQTELVKEYMEMSEKEEEIAQTELVKEYMEMNEKEEEIGQTELVEKYKEMSEKEEEIEQTELVEKYREINEKKEEIEQTELVEEYKEMSEKEGMGFDESEMQMEHEEMEEEYEEIEREDGEMDQEDEEMEHRDLDDEEKNDDTGHNEIITIQFVSDSEEELNTAEEELNTLEEELNTNETIFKDENPDIAETLEPKNDLNCNECKFEAENKLFLLIHEMIIHEKKDELGVFHCPQANCEHSTKLRTIFRNHLSKRHGYDLNMFYAKELQCPHCYYVAKEPHHLLIHTAAVHKIANIESKNVYECRNCSFVAPRKYLVDQHMKKCGAVNILKEDSSVNKSGKKLHRCKFCEFATINKLCYFKHIKHGHKTEKITDNANQLLLCKYCEQKFQGRYQSAWHRFDVHKDKSELSKWRLRCQSCDFEDCSKLNCHKHGMEHQSGKVSFQKFYQGRPTGYIHIRFKQLYVKLDKLPDNALRNNGNVGGKLEIARANNNRRRDTRSSSRGKAVKLLENRGTETDTDADNTLNPSDGSIRTFLDWSLSDDKNAKEQKEKKVILPSKNYIFNECDEMDESDNDDGVLLKKSEVFTCGVPLCTFETKDESYLTSHEIVAHGDTCNEEMYPCPICHSKTKYKKNYRRHLMSVHHYKIKDLFSDEQIAAQKDRKAVTAKFNDESDCIRSQWIYTCQHCDFKSKHKRNHVRHIKRFHKSKIEDLSNQQTEQQIDQKATKVINKVKRFCNDPDEEDRIENTQRVAETKDKNAFCFVLDEEEQPTEIATEMMEETGEFGSVSDEEEQTFEKATEMMEENEEFCVGFGEEDRQQTTGRVIKIKRKYKDYCNLCERSFGDKYQLHLHLFKIHGSKTELSKWRMRCTVCGFVTTLKRYAQSHASIKHSTIYGPISVKFEMLFKNSFHGIYNYECPKKELHSCSKCDYVAGTIECLKRHLKRHDNPNFVPLYEISKRRARSSAIRRGRMKDNGGENTGIYTTKELMDILGPNKLEKHNDTKNLNNEVITIEIIPEADKDMEKPNCTSSSNLNPFTGELILEGSDDEVGESSIKQTTTYKCSNPGCMYICKDFEKISRHVKACSLTKPRKKLVQKFTCHMCKQVMTKRNLLQGHCNDHAVTLNQPDLVVRFSEVTNDDFMCDFELQADLNELKPDIMGETLSKVSRVTYKCWMCGYLLQTKNTLTNHTNIHAREDGNFKLKVRYTKFRNDKEEGTVIMQADPNFIISKRNVPKTTVVQPEYDPDLPVFSCSNCNFKTNDQDALRTHKKLHWTPRKEALFKAQKWYTCSFCFFHCFDAETLKKHNDWHRKHPTSTGVIRKMGTNSWFLT